VLKTCQVSSQAQKPSGPQAQKLKKKPRQNRVKILTKQTAVLYYFQNGIFSAIPFLCMYITGVSAGQLADWLRYNKILSTGEVRKVFATGG